MSCDILPISLLNVFRYIEGNQEKFINTLKEAVEIPSTIVPYRRQDAIFMVHWMAEKMVENGIEVEISEFGYEELPNGIKLNLPSIIFAKIGNDKNKKTVLIYCHLDVAVAEKEDGWDTDPFTMVVKDGKLYGRGTADDKGAAVGWIHAIEAYRNTNLDIPVNIKFLYLGIQEGRVFGLEDFLKKKESFFRDVDYCCVSDGTWLSTGRPCISYGVRGICFFNIEITCAKKNLHSGFHGGSVKEAMTDLVYLLNRLVDVDGKILIPGVYDDVDPVTSQEEKMYATIDFDVDEFKRSRGIHHLFYNDKVKLLMASWRYPSLSIHGIEGGHSKPGSSSVIPKRVIGKFSIRLVTNQDPGKICELTINYLDELWKNRNSKNDYKTVVGICCKPWVSAINNENYKAAWRATNYVYGCEPDMIREGSTVPIMVLLQELTKKNIVMLPMGSGDDGTLGQNEKLNIYNFIKGTQLFAAYLHELGNCN